MGGYCRYYALGADAFSGLLDAPEKLDSLQSCIDKCVVSTWECSTGDTGNQGLGQVLSMLSGNAERFAPLDVAPLELQEAWELLADTLNTDADRFTWSSNFTRAGLTSPKSLAKLVFQLHKTKCLELLLPTPISGPTKTNIISLCRFLEEHNNGREWILAVESL